MPYADLEEARAYRAAYYAKHRDRLKIHHADYYKKNREAVAVSGKNWVQRNKEKVKNRTAEYYRKNSQKIKARASRHYYENKEHHRDLAAAYSKKNKEKLKAYKAQWARENRERHNANGAAWRKRNPEAVKAMRTRTAKNHPQIAVERRLRRRAREQAAGTSPCGPSIVKILRAKKCYWCGGIGKMTVDHVVALADGGRHEPSNLVPSCLSCNCGKGAKSVLEFTKKSDCIQQIGFRMKIAAYRGRSLVSRLIQLQSWSAYSHIAILDPDDGFCVYESWTEGGISCNDHLGRRHSENTHVDLFSLKQPFTQEEQRQVRMWLRSQLGKKYDWRAILRFLIRKNNPGDPDKLVCSEYAFVAFMKGNRELQSRIEPWRVSPALVVISALLQFDQTVITSRSGTIIPIIGEEPGENLPPPAALASPGKPVEMHERYEPSKEGPKE